MALGYKRRAAFRAWRASKRLRTARWAAASSRLAARRALVSRGLTGGGLALGALAGYGIYRGVRRIRRARARRYRRRQIAHPIRKLPSKSNQLATQTLTNRSTIDLYTARISDIPRTTTDEEDARTGTTANLIGWRLYLQLRNELATPQLVNIAIVSDKHFQQGETQTAPETEMFRGYTNARTVSFSNALTSTELTNFPINTDRYVPLHRWKYLLAAKHGEDHQTNPSKASFIQLKKWIPLRRQVRFTDTGSIADTGSVFIYVWSDVPMRPGLGAATTNALSFQYTFIQFFKDPK